MSAVIQTVQANGTLVDKASSGFFSDLFDTFLFPLTGKTDERLTSTGAMYMMATHELAGSLWGGYVGRSRANAGKQAMLGFIY